MAVLLQLSVMVLGVAALFFYNDPAATEIYTLSLHDALPISAAFGIEGWTENCQRTRCRHSGGQRARSEEHTSELQSRFDLVCRLLLEKKNRSNRTQTSKPAIPPLPLLDILRLHAFLSL